MHTRIPCIFRVFLRRRTFASFMEMSRLVARTLGFAALMVLGLINMTAEAAASAGCTAFNTAGLDATGYYTIDKNQFQAGDQLHLRGPSGNTIFFQGSSMANPEMKFPVDYTVTSADAANASDEAFFTFNYTGSQPDGSVIPSEVSFSCDAAPSGRGQTVVLNGLSRTQGVTAGTPKTFSATSTSGLPVSFTVNTTSTNTANCSVVAGLSGSWTLSATAAGQCTISASVAGDTNYDAFTDNAYIVVTAQAASQTGLTPELISLSPSESTSGGETVIITGNNLQGVTTILFGNKPIIVSEDLKSANQIKVKAPTISEAGTTTGVPIYVYAQAPAADGSPLTSNPLPFTYNKLVYSAPPAIDRKTFMISGGLTTIDLAGATGGTGSYTYRITVISGGGNLAFTSTTSSDGRFQVRGLIPGSTQIAVTVSDSGGQTTAPTNLEFFVASPLILTARPIIYLTLNSAVPSGVKPVTASGGSGIYNYTRDPTTELPDGLAIDNGTGEFTGTPTKAFNGPIKLNVYSGSLAEQISFTLVVGGTPLAAQTVGLNGITQTPSVTLGTPTTFTATSSSRLQVIFTVNATNNTANCSITPLSFSAGVGTYKLDTTAAGGCSISANVAGDSTNAAFTDSAFLRVTASAVVNPALQVAATQSTVNLTLKSPINTAIKIVNVSGGSGSYSYAPDVATPLPAGLSLTTTGELNGTPTATFNGPITINVTSGGETKSATFTLAIVKPKATIILSASKLNPGRTDTADFTARVTPATATGTVTFTIGATTYPAVALSNEGVAKLNAIGPLPDGAYSSKAVYNGDDLYDGVTSNTLLIRWGIRPDPTADKTVRAIVAAQAGATLRMASVQIDTVQRRLETLHEDDVPGFANGVSISAPSGLPPGASPFDDPVLRGQGFSKSEAGNALDRTFDKTFGKDPNLASEKAAPRNSFGLLEKSRFKVWTAGSVIFGGVHISTLGVVTKSYFTLAGVTAGVDTQLMDGLRGGFAMSYSGERADLGDDGSRMNSRGLTGSLYGSWRVTGKFFLDGTLGYGDMSFSTKRFDANAANFITGQRQGKMVFGSLALSYDAKMGPLKFSPYARLDVIDATLNAYTEAGDAYWTLSYEKAGLASRSLVLGLRGQYDFEQPWGVISPTWRLEYRRALSGELRQMMTYTTDPSASYGLTATGSDRDTLSAALGLKAQARGDVAGSLEYMLSGGVKRGLQGQGMRGMVKMGF